VRRHVLDPAQSDAADALAALLGCNRDNGFALDLSAPFVLFRAANIGFVDLDRSAERVAARPHHGPAQLVQPSPGRLIAAEPKRPLQSERADAVLLARHEPHGHEPGPQRLARALENRPRGERRTRVTAAAAKQFVRHRPRRAAHAAMRANEALRPAHASNVLPTRLIVSEPLVDLLERARVIDTGYGMRVTVHPRQIAPRLRSVKGIPTSRESLEDGAARYSSPVDHWRDGRRSLGLAERLPGGKLATAHASAQAKDA